MTNRLNGYMHDLGNKLVLAEANLVKLSKKVNVEESEESFIIFKKSLEALNRSMGLFNEMKKNVTHLEASIDLKPIKMGDRYKTLDVSIPRMQNLYNVTIDLCKNKCPDDVKVYSKLHVSDRILENCVENAHRAGATKILIKYVANESTVEVHINDNGKGMSEEVLKQIGFGYTEGGTGKGIGIIRDLAHQAGGVVEWHSVEGIGTKCVVTLGRVLSDVKQREVA